MVIVVELVASSLIEQERATQVSNEVALRGPPLVWVCALLKYIVRVNTVCWKLQQCLCATIIIVVIISICFCIFGGALVTVGAPTCWSSFKHKRWRANKVEGGRYIYPTGNKVANLIEFSHKPQRSSYGRIVFCLAILVRFPVLGCGCHLLPPSPPFGSQSHSGDIFSIEPILFELFEGRIVLLVATSNVCSSSSSSKF